VPINHRTKIIATVVEPGACRYYRQGRQFLLSGFTPPGICDSAYAVLSRDAQTMAYGGALPWGKDGKVLTRCPDPGGALWALCRAGPEEADKAGAKAGRQSSAPGETNASCEVQTCRASEGGCPNALTALSELKEGIETAVRASGWEEFLREQVPGRPLPHQRLRIALAACPNACTQPQTRDIGAVACRRPVRISPACTGCGRCEEVCREDAIVVENETARWDPVACVGCGLCIRECPAGVIEGQEVQFRLLVGGRLGRHPRWAEELPEMSAPADVPGTVDKLLGVILREVRPGQKVSYVVERLGARRLWQAMPAK
jgi:dissimilatory sulfite reductase (desulfoviridin) alpha/beta subunit